MHGHLGADHGLCVLQIPASNIFVVLVYFFALGFGIFYLFGWLVFLFVCLVGFGFVCLVFCFDKFLLYSPDWPQIQPLPVSLFPNHAGVIAKLYLTWSKGS